VKGFPKLCWTQSYRLTIVVQKYEQSNKHVANPCCGKVALFFS
jgi:hypothetical protein